MLPAAAACSPTDYLLPAAVSELPAPFCASLQRPWPPSHLPWLPTISSSVCNSFIRILIGLLYILSGVIALVCSPLGPTLLPPPPLPSPVFRQTGGTGLPRLTAATLPVQPTCYILPHYYDSPALPIHHLVNAHLPSLHSEHTDCNRHWTTFSLPHSYYY